MKAGVGTQWAIRFEDLSTYPEPSRNACCRLMDGTRILTRSNADAIRHEQDGAASCEPLLLVLQQMRSRIEPVAFAPTP